MVTREMSQPLPKADYGQMEDPLSALFRAFISMFDTRPPVPERASRTFTEPKQSIFDELFTGSLGESWPRESSIDPNFDEQIAADQARRQRTAAAAPRTPTMEVPEMNPAFHPTAEERGFIPSPTQAGTLMRSLLGLPEPNPLFHTQEPEYDLTPTMGNLQSFAQLLAQPEPQQPPAQRPLPPGYKQESVKARKVK